jgi:hypothetical protein
MRIHQTAVWRVRHKRSFLVVGADPAKTGFDRTDSHTFLAHLSKLRQIAVLATTRLYVPEILFSAEKTRQEMFQSRNVP